PQVISQGGGHFNVHPSIDAAQDVWFDAQEMVTWENHSVQYLRVKAPGFKEMDPQWLDISSIHVTSLYTPTIRTVDPLHPGNTSYWNPFWDDIKPTKQWTYSVDNRFIISNTGLSRYIDYYPSISSLNGRDSMHQNEKIYFSLATSAIANAYNHEPMAQSIQQYAIHDPAELYTYLHGGNHVNGAASPTRQPLREAMLYEIPATATDLQTTRQFFAKLHPTGYTARGRQLGIPVNDTLVTGYSVGLYNVWTADNSTTHPLAMISYPDTVHRTDSLAMVQSLMRTEDFHAHDSTEISLSYYSGIYGDSTAIDSTRLTLVAELVDSATGMVVQPLDSMTVSDTAGTFYRVIDSVVDLMSGTYFVRVRIVPQNLPALAGMNDSRFPVAEIAGYIGDSLMGKLRHIDAVTGGTGRLSVHPNPTSGRAEILFSVPEQEQAAVTIYDAFGRRIVQPLEGTMEAGRYAIDLNGGALPPGTYMVEFRYGENRLVEKLVVVR
ncbi:MAG: T9SS type A sorting domain-containing protein, partial [Bacteroidota bacterium]